MRLKYLSELIFLFLYTLIAAVFIYPLIFKFNTSIYGYPSDSFVTVWKFWRWTEGDSIMNSVGPYLPHFCGKWLSLLTNEVFAYNLLLFASFPLSALVMYWLTFELTKHKYASFVSGLIYSFSLYHLWHGFSHLSLSQIQWLPLYVWSLIKLSQRRNLKWSVVTAGVYLLTFLTDYYYGYFLFLFTAAFVFGQFVLKKIDFKLFKCYFLTALLIILTTAPIISGLRQSLVASRTSTRPFDDLLALSARPWDYLLPSIYHPVYGKFVEPIYQAIRDLGNDFEYQSAFLPERVIYLGFTALALAILGLIRGLKTQHRPTVVLFGICLFLMLWASGPAYISVRSLRIPFPSLFLYRLFPMFRAYVRLGILVLLCVAVLAGFGVKFFLERIKNKRLLPTAYCLLPLLVLFELLNFPPFHNTDFSQIPEVYQWLKSQPGDFVIAEYPRDNDTSFGCEDVTEPVVRNYGYGKFFQRVHGKKLFESEDKLSNLTNPEVPKLLSSFGVKYVVVHTGEIFAMENPLDSCHGWGIMPKLPSDIQGLTLIEEFPKAVVYKVLE